MNARLLATALMLAGATAACTPEQQAAWDRLAGLEPIPTPPAAAEAPPEPEAPATAAFVAAAAPEPEPPGPVYEYDLYNANPVGYVCTPIFRVLSCLDDGTPVYLNDQMAQLPFGAHP